MIELFAPIQHPFLVLKLQSILLSLGVFIPVHRSIARQVSAAESCKKNPLTKIWSIPVLFVSGVSLAPVTCKQNWVKTLQKWDAPPKIPLTKDLFFHWHMAQRYVRIQTTAGQLFYGLLHLDRRVQLLDAPPWLQGQLTNEELTPDTYKLLAPCAPSKIVAVGKNYLKHAIEMGGEVPREPLLFFKPSTAIIAPEVAIQYPKQTQRVDYEGELALVMGDRCVDCSPAVARSKIWGYTIANDVTARDLQKKDGQWTRAKGFDTFCPLGPWVVRDISAGARLQTFLNDSNTPVQSATIDEMVFPPEVLVSYISQAITLLPGDVVLTGTPEGVGQLQVGDRVRVEIEGIGSLENPVVARKSLEAIV